MPFTENIALEQAYTTAQPGNTFSYSTIDTTDALADSAQIEVRWELVTVTDAALQPVSVSELPSTSGLRSMWWKMSTSHLALRPRP